MIGVDTTEGSASVAEWKIEATWVAVDTNDWIFAGRWKIDGDRLTNAKKQSATTRMPKGSKKGSASCRLKKGSAACRWMDGTCRINGSMRRSGENEDRATEAFRLCADAGLSLELADEECETTKQSVSTESMRVAKEEHRECAPATEEEEDRCGCNECRLTNKRRRR